MTLSRGSAEGEEEREDGQGSQRREPSTCGSRLDDSCDRRKSQAQRLLEFEMWTNHNTLKDLEYSQRRSEKKQRQRERRKYYQKRCWKKLYLPAVLSMVIGTFLTLCATLQSLAGDTFLWNARGVLVYLGPTLIGVGFLALMLAAGCTFKHDQEARQKGVAPPSEFLIPGFLFQYRRPSSAVRSNSVMTSDLPLPPELDLSRNYVEGRSAGWPSRGSGKMGRTRSVSWDDSVHSVGPLTLGNSYSSTATWVQFVSAAHSQAKPVSLTCQNSDVTHLVSSSANFQEVPPSLEDTDQGHLGSQSDLQVTCTRSVTSSGYHSASDSTSGTAEYQMSCESSQWNSSYTPLRHNAFRSVNHCCTKTPVRESKLAGNRNVRGSLDTTVGHLYPEIAKKPQQQNNPQSTPLSQRKPVSLTFSSLQAFHKGANILKTDRNSPNSPLSTESNGQGSITRQTMARLNSPDVFAHGKTETQSAKATDHMLIGSTNQVRPEPRLLYPSVCSVLSTDL